MLNPEELRGGHTNNPVRGILVVLLMAMPLLACCGNKHDFSPLGPITTANLWISASDGSKYGWKISDPKDLSRIVTFVDSQRANWSAPWFGVPMPTVEVQLFDGQHLKRTFGAGKNHFEAQYEGRFLSKRASSGEIRGFFDAVNLDDTTLKKYTK